MSLVIPVIMSLSILNKEIGLLVNFADFAIDVRQVELERKRPR